MARDIVINGPCLVGVRGGAHVPAWADTVKELGLSSEEIRIGLVFHRQDINASDYGNNVPAEQRWGLAEANIKMTLVHYDRGILDSCIAEAMGGTIETQVAVPGVGFLPTTLAGTLQPAGSLMGNMVPLQSSGCHYISVNLTSPVLGFPWRFKACYLAEPAVEIPLGTKRSMTALTWRCIPYAVPADTLRTYYSGTILAPGEIVSSGITLWDHTLDA